MSKPPCPDKPVNPFVIVIALPIALICMLFMYLSNLRLTGISVKKDKENKIIEGNPDKIKFVTDSWKFTRNIKQKDPNWYLSEIISK